MIKEHYVRPDDPKKLEYLPPNKIILGDSKVQGRGVFATVNIKKGEVVERCPLVEMGNRSRYQLDPQVFAYMYAQLPCGCDDCNKHGFVMHMAGGYGMMYNHQDNPNALLKFNYRQLLVDVIAIKDIAIGEEIYISYGNCYFNNSDAQTGIEQVRV